MTLNLYNTASNPSAPIAAASPHGPARLARLVRLAARVMSTIHEFRRPRAVVSSLVHAACLPGAADALDAANLQKDAR